MNNYLSHHGIKGQKWGIRRYQNKDGSLTAEGKKKYSKYYNSETQTLTKKGRQLLSISSYGRAIGRQSRVSEKQFAKALNKSYGEMAYAGVITSFVLAKISLDIGKIALNKSAQKSTERRYEAAHVVDEFINKHKDVDWSDPALKDAAEKQASNYINKKKWSGKDLKNLNSVLDNVYNEYMGVGSYTEISNSNDFSPYGYLDYKNK